MSSVGINAETWMPLTGWDHVYQSIWTILSTMIGERVFLRQFGSDVLDAIDKPQNHETLLKMYMGVAEALEPRIVDGAQLGEPRFLLTNVSISPSPTGLVGVEINGDYFPNGHLGDYTAVERSISISIPVGA